MDQTRLHRYIKEFFHSCFGDRQKLIPLAAETTFVTKVMYQVQEQSKESFSRMIMKRQIVEEVDDSFTVSNLMVTLTIMNPTLGQIHERYLVEYINLKPYPSGKDLVDTMEEFYVIHARAGVEFTDGDDVTNARNLLYIRSMIGLPETVLLRAKTVSGQRPPHSRRSSLLQC